MKGMLNEAENILHFSLDESLGWTSVWEDPTQMSYESKSQDLIMGDQGPCNFGPLLVILA